MQLEQVAAKLRPRTQPEAADLGLRLAWHWWRTAFAAWFATAVPFFAIGLLAFRENPIWGVLFIWWVKPLLDTVLLDVYSRALFGDRPRALQVLGGVPALWKRTALSALTIWRLDPLRLLAMPVKQLERQSGRAMFARRQLLSKAAGGEVLRDTFVFFLFEWSLLLGPFFALNLFIPDSSYEIWFNVNGPEAVTAQRIWVACYVLAITVLEPFFVGCGFSIYINRRTHLEAWDIEVDFRKMARRLEAMVKSAPAILLVVSIAALSLAAAQDDAVSVDAPNEALAMHQHVQERIEEILSDEDFGKEETREVWRWKGSERESSSSTNLPPIGSALAAAIEPIVWILAIVAMSILGYRLLMRLETSDLPIGGRRRPRAAETVMGMDVREEHLPDDVAGTARRLWETGDFRGALRLLYRASIARMIARDGVLITASATEHDVLRAAAGALAPERLSYFDSLTRVWQITAYGHREPSPDDLHLVDGWPGHFESGS